MSKTDSYWERRKAKLIHQQMDKAEIQANEIAKLYDQAKADLMRQADKIFDKFRRDYGLSEAQARQILKQIKDPSKLDELRKVLEASPQDENIQLLLADLDSSAYAARIRRLEELQTQVSAMGDQLAQRELNSATGFYKGFVEDSYYRNMFELQAQAGVGFGFDLLSETQIKAVINSKWLGDNYSSRIWSNVTGLARSLQSELLVFLLTGKTEREMAEALAERFAVGQHQARRLVRTESAYFFNEMDARAMEDADIELYRLVAVLDLKTSKICQQKDGQVHQLKDRKNGVNYPPFHPWCRTGAISNFDEEWLKTAKRWSRDADGKVHYVPADMTWPEWYAEYVDKSKEKVYNPNMDRTFDYMAQSKRFSANSKDGKVITAKTKKQAGTMLDIWSENDTKQSRDTIELLKDTLNGQYVSDLPTFVILTHKKLPGLAAYDYTQDVLFISNKLNSDDTVKEILSDGFFAATDFSELLKHELTHKRHWDRARTIYKSRPKLYNNIEAAKKELDSDLLVYVKSQQQHDFRYLAKEVSENAFTAFFSENLNELVADVNVKIDKIKDKHLVDKVKEVLGYD